MIHGTKKVKKVLSEEQIKSDQELSEKIIKHLNQFIQLRHKQKQDLNYLNQFTQILMQLCPDISTIYNFRRQLIVEQINKLPQQQKKQKILEFNLKLTTKLIKGDPKSYNIWSFRQWLVTRLFQEFKNEKILLQEHELCKMMLLKDQKNFHVWNYRNWLNTFKIDLDIALNFTHQKIKANPFNFSPYHFRTKHLFKKYEKILENKHSEEILLYGMEKIIFDQQLEMIKTAIFLNPQQEAPWLYYRWLLTSILPFGVISQRKQAENKYYLVLNAKVRSFSNNIIITRNQQKLEKWKLVSKTQTEPSNEWYIIFEENIEQIQIEIKSNFQIAGNYVISQNRRSFFGNKQIKQKEAIKKIFESQLTFIRQVNQSEQFKCRYASQELLYLKKVFLFFCETKSEWNENIKDVNDIFETLSQESKGKKYIQKIQNIWTQLMTENKGGISQEENILIEKLNQKNQ